MSSSRAAQGQGSRTAPRRTLWEEGRHPGRLVRTMTVGVLLVVATLEILLLDGLGLVFDSTFVVLCLVGALAVRPRDFFVVGVLPPLSMLLVVAVLAVVARPVVAEAGDGLFQATVSGLAHHAGALVAGYALTLAILAVRNVAVGNAGAIRGGGRPRSSARAGQLRLSSRARRSRRSSGGSAKINDSSAEWTARASG